MNTERDPISLTSATRRGRRRPGKAWIGAAALLLAGLQLAPAPPAFAQFIHWDLGGGKEKEKNVAGALALVVGQCRQRFDQRRRGLTTMTDMDGRRVHFRSEVLALIDRTEQDLDQSIARLPEPRLAGLRAWAAAEIQRVRRELAAPPGERTAALWSGLRPGLVPRAVAVTASLGARIGDWLPLPGGVAATAAEGPGTIDTGKSIQFLDQVAAVIERIFFLAKKDDLEVKLWVGSTPTPEADFQFWSQASVKDAPPAPQTIRANGKRERVLRGLYFYKAALGSGPLTQFVEYPPRAGAPRAQLASERLDLVNGSSFFCCHFSKSYCQHVDDDKECRPTRR
jgi:hypothetical protein